MKKTILYYCDGQYMEARKIRRRYKKGGFDFGSASRKNVFKKTMDERFLEIVPYIELFCILGIIAIMIICLYLYL